MSQPRCRTHRCRGARLQACARPSASWRCGVVFFISLVSGLLARSVPDAAAGHHGAWRSQHAQAQRALSAMHGLAGGAARRCRTSEGLAEVPRSHSVCVCVSYERAPTLSCAVGRTGCALALLESCGTALSSHPMRCGTVVKKRRAGFLTRGSKSFVVDVRCFGPSVSGSLKQVCLLFRGQDRSRRWSSRRPSLRSGWRSVGRFVGELVVSSLHMHPPQTRKTESACVCVCP